jgi:hypothetical protein
MKKKVSFDEKACILEQETSGIIILDGVEQSGEARYALRRRVGNRSREERRRSLLQPGQVEG